jgi:hypothetical protein
MAGDWTPLRDNIHDDPDVYAIAAALNVRDSDLVVGKLTRFWAWASQHTEDGRLAGVTREMIDRIAKQRRFAEVLIGARWLNDDDGVLVIPRFDRWMSRSAKARLSETKARQLRRVKGAKRPDSEPDLSGQCPDNRANLSGPNPDYTTGQDRTVQTTQPFSSREPVRGTAPAASASADSAWTGDQRAVLDYLALAEVGRLKATELTMAGLTLADARRVNDARKQAGKPADGKFIAQLKAAAVAGTIRAGRRAAMTGGSNG